MIVFFFFLSEATPDGSILEFGTWILNECNFFGLGVLRYNSFIDDFV